MSGVGIIIPVVTSHIGRLAVPFWLASGLLLGLAPIFAWSGRRTHERSSGPAQEVKLVFGSQDAR